MILASTTGQLGAHYQFKDMTYFFIILSRTINSVYNIRSIISKYKVDSTTN